MQGLEPYPSYPLSIVAVMQFVLWGWVTICLQYTAGYITANFFVFEHILPSSPKIRVALVIGLHQYPPLVLVGDYHGFPLARFTHYLPHP